MSVGSGCVFGSHLPTLAHEQAKHELLRGPWSLPAALPVPERRWLRVPLGGDPAPTTAASLWLCEGISMILESPQARRNTIAASAWQDLPCGAPLAVAARGSSCSERGCGKTSRSHRDDACFRRRRFSSAWLQPGQPLPYRVGVSWVIAKASLRSVRRGPRTDLEPPSTSQSLFLEGDQ
ncbi:uncharacterized protein LOC129197626 isoform X2 [Grus americana]|nr:uncharacterized protein LOC129197626 isoform X2 [Grus americana]